jgi:hypothetical protein
MLDSVTVDGRVPDSDYCESVPAVSAISVLRVAKTASFDALRENNRSNHYETGIGGLRGEVANPRSALAEVGQRRADDGYVHTVGSWSDAVGVTVVSATRYRLGEALTRSTAAVSVANDRFFRKA